MKIIKLFTLTAATFGISACVSSTISNRNYQFEKNASNGIAALAVQCVGSGMVDIKAEPNTPNLFRNSLLEQYLFTVNCSDGITNYKLINLSSGEYQISDIAPTEERAVDFKPIKFTVFPGKVNYIGHLKLEIMPPVKGAPEGGIHWTLFDRAYYDVPIFQAKFPKISAKRYKYFGK